MAEFFLQSLQQQKARLEKKIEQERLLLGDLPELSVQILELCRHRGRVTVAEAVKVTGANRNTIKDHFKALVRARHLVRHGAGRGACADWTAPGITDTTKCPIYAGHLRVSHSFS